MLGTSPSSDAPRRSLWNAGVWAFPVALFAATRVGLMAVSHFGMRAVPVLQVPGGLPQLAPYPAIDGLCRWDCGWFNQLADVGYRQPMDSNFWPLFPLLAKGLTYLGIPLHLGLLLLPNLAGLLAYVVLYRIFVRATDVQAARWALIAFAAYPFAFFQATGYPESLMILFSALSVWLALDGRHLLAGLALGVGTLARHITILTGPALAAAQLRQRGVKRFFLSVDFLGLLIPFLVAGLYPLWLKYKFGDPMAFWKARDAWGSMAWWSANELIKRASGSPELLFYGLFALLPTVGAVALCFRKRWFELATYGVFMMAVLWAVGAAGLGRYSASCWPAFLPLGIWLSRHPLWQTPAVLLLACAQGIFFNLFLHHYPIL